MFETDSGAGAKKQGFDLVDERRGISERSKGPAAITAAQQRMKSAIACHGPIAARRVVVSVMEFPSRLPVAIGRSALGAGARGI